MHDGTFCTRQRFKRTLNQMITCLNQYFDVNIIWNMIFFNQFTCEIEIHLRCRRKANFNMFKTNLYQHLEHFEFLIDIHRFKNRLVTITEVSTHPNWRFIDFIIRPLTVWQVNTLIHATIFFTWISQHHEVTPCVGWIAQLFYKRQSFY